MPCIHLHRIFEAVPDGEYIVDLLFYRSIIKVGVGDGHEQAVEHFIVGASQLVCFQPPFTTTSETPLRV